MPTTQDPLAAYSIATEVLHCIEDRLEDQPTRSCVVVGNVAWDDCECGQLTVSILRTYLSSRFPADVSEPAGGSYNARCGSGILVIEFVATLLRCASESEGDEPPTCAQLSDDAFNVVNEMSAVRTAVLCCLMTMINTVDNGVRKIEDYIVEAQEVVGPEGMCVGSQLFFRVGIMNVCPCAQ